jgi:ABC-type multidrug transport system fused ATPase/permease subunit
MKDYKIILRFLSYLKPYWAKETVLFFLMISGSVAGLASPYILKLILDNALPARDFDYLVNILWVLFAINIARIVITFVSDYLYELVSNYMIRDMRMDLFRHLIRLPVSFFDKNKAGDILHRINNEINTIQSIVTGSVLRFINSLLTIIGITVALVWLNYKLFLIALIALPFILINTVYFQPKIQRIIKLSREKDSDILCFFVERFESIKLIKTYLTYDFEQNKLFLLIKSLINLNVRNTVLSSATRNISTFLISFSPLLILYWGGRQIMASAMTIGSLVAFLQYLNRLYNPMRDLMSLYFDFVRASVSMKRVFEFLKTPVEDTGRPAANHFRIRKKIVFDHVSYSFDGQNKVLDNLNLEFELGKRYALVGASGCGKSTLINLLCRFYETEEGTIRVDGQNIQQISLDTLRSRIGLIGQESMLFHDSIRGNIGYGSANPSDAKIKAAAMISGIYEHVVSLQDGFDTMVGDRGAKLSGGQKQRVALARAILKDADVIILDEATSGLDSDSEKMVFDKMVEIYRDKAMIFISHRISTVKNVDEIICMHDGKIVEKGGFEELIAKKGFYWKLFQTQIE